MKPNLKKIGIIGAGPSGLALNLFLKKTADIFEATDHVGGHASSFFANGFTFDYGPHILFSKDPSILNFIIATLNDNVSRCRRNNKISFKNRLLKYPFENDLASLPKEDNYECLHDFLFNRYKEQFKSPVNMREWFLKTFGKGICEKYLFPYNEKVWNIPVDELAMSLAERIPNPPPEDILKSALGISTEGYLHQLYYYYPKRGGYQAICESWKTSAHIYFNSAIKKINIKTNGIQLVNQKNEAFEYEKIVSTMPVHELVKYLNIKVPIEITHALNALIINPMYVVSFGIKGEDHNKYTAIYFPEKEFWVNRISFPKTFSAENAPADYWSLQAEITCHRHSAIWKLSDSEILEHVKKGLQQRNLLPADDAIVFTRVDRKEKSYVVYNVGYEEKVKKVRGWFSSMGIELLGRFGHFEYINVDMAVMRALELAIKLNQEATSFDELKYVYIEDALTRLRATGVVCQE